MRPRPRPPPPPSPRNPRGAARARARISLRTRVSPRAVRFGERDFAGVRRVRFDRTSTSKLGSSQFGSSKYSAKWLRFQKLRYADGRSARGVRCATRAESYHIACRSERRRVGAARKRHRNALLERFGVGSAVRRGTEGLAAPRWHWPAALAGRGPDPHDLFTLNTQPKPRAAGARLQRKRRKAACACDACTHAKLR